MRSIVLAFLVLFVPMVAAAQEPLDLHQSTVQPGRLLVTHAGGDGPVVVEFETDAGRRGSCTTPCSVLADGGTLHVHSGRMTRVVHVEAATVQDLEVDPGWDDHAWAEWVTSVVYGAVGLVLVAVSTIALTVGANCHGDGLTRACDLWPFYMDIPAGALLLTSLVVQIVAIADPVAGGVRSRPAGVERWTDGVAASLSPLFDTHGTVVGAAGGLTLTF